MRPSSISFISVSRATSRRIPSNDESTTALGVSSMMKSTPVRCSSARMFRPSRPMMRPFMSSDGSSTSVTVVSAAALAATRCSASATRLRARRFASAGGLLLELPDAPARARAGPAPRDSSRIRCLASPVVSPEMRSSSRRCAVARLLQLLLQLLEVDLAVGDALLAPRELRELAVDVVLLLQDALLDLDDVVAPAAELGLELGAELDRLLPRLDLRLAPRRVRVAARLLEQQRRVRRAASSRDPATQPQRDQRRGRTGDESDHDCQRRLHGRSLRALSPHGAHRRSALAPARRRARRSISGQVLRSRGAGWSS